MIVLAFLSGIIFAAVLCAGTLWVLDRKYGPVGKDD